MNGRPEWLEMRAKVPGWVACGNCNEVRVSMRLIVCQNNAHGPTPYRAVLPTAAAGGQFAPWCRKRHRAVGAANRHRANR